MTNSTSDGSEALATARAVIRADAAAVTAVADQLDDSFLHLARMLRDGPGRVATVGSGTSGAVARRMAHLLSVTGTPAFYLHPADALHGSVGVITAGDIVIALSKGGESKEVNECARRALDRGATIVALTATADGSLASLADHVVVVVTPDEADPGGFVAMGSTVAISAWTDALCVVLMRATGYGWDDVLHSHPAGAVGQRTDLPEALAPLSLGSAPTAG